MHHANSEIGKPNLSQSYNGEEKAGCSACFVPLLYCDCFVALPRGAMDLSAVCDCCIS